MDKVVAFIMALIMYLTNLITALPVFIENIKKKDIDDFKWIITEGDIQDVDYDTYYEYYQEFYVPPVGQESTVGLKDVTQQYQALLDENLEIARGWKTTPGSGQINFYNSVKDFGIWDYKRTDAHRELAEEWGIGIDDRFMVYGVAMNWEVLGNVNFAFTGAAVGFTPTTIKTGGGVVNIKNGHADWEEIKFYYDEENDSNWITFGIGLYMLRDVEYEDQVELIDSFFEVADPRFAEFLYKVYVDQKKAAA